MGSSNSSQADRFIKHLEPIQGALEAYCQRSLVDRAKVGDVLQSAILQAYKDFQLYAEGSNFRAWMFRYVHLEIFNANRRSARDRHEELPGELPSKETGALLLDEPLFKVLLDDPDQVLEQCDAPLADAIRNLPAAERAVFLLRVIGDFKYREIAEILQIPLGAVMGYLGRSRLRLRQQLLEFGKQQGFLTTGPDHGPEREERGQS